MNGGLNFFDFTTFNNTFKINWIKHFQKNPTSTWNFIPNYIFSKVGGQVFFLWCDYKIEKIPLIVSKFHKQMLLAWSLIYKHNFSPHRCFIWNNRFIKFKNKSLIHKTWINSIIIQVSQLVNDNGTLLNNSEFSHFSNHPKRVCYCYGCHPIWYFNSLERDWKTRLFTSFGP